MFDEDIQHRNQDKIIVANQTAKHFDKLSPEELLVLHNINIINARECFANKDDFDFVRLGKFQIHNSRRVSLEHEAKYAKEKGFEYKKLSYDRQEKIKSDLRKKRFKQRFAKQNNEHVSTFKQSLSKIKKSNK